MKIYKKIILLLLSAVMVFTLMPATGFADDYSDPDDSYYEDDDENYGEENFIAPKSAAFEGETGDVYIGDYLPSARKLLYKVGNKITISYVDGTTRVFECRKFEAKAKGLTWYEYVCDESEYALFLDAFMSGKVKKGENKVSIFIEYNAPGDAYSIPDGNDLTAEITVNATKLFAKVVEKDFTYTGKALTPKIVVKDCNGKVIPSKAYTVKYYNKKTDKYSSKPVGKAVDRYRIKAVIKKAYRDKYIDTIEGIYTIVPKRAVLTKVIPGKKQITLKWKKQTKAMDLYLIQYATDKKFKDSNWVEVSKKKTSYVLKKLKSNKIYYVRLYTAKPISTGEVAFSKPSKVFKVKVR